jgi:hypothetical protein
MAPGRRRGLVMKSSRESVFASRFTVQTALGSLIGITVLYLGREVLIPIALALLLSFLLAPPMVRLQRWGLGVGLRKDFRCPAGRRSFILRVDPFVLSGFWASLQPFA